MGFSYFIAVLGLVLSTALLGFIIGGAHESEAESSAEYRARRPLVLVGAGLVLVALTQGMVLFGSGLIEPVWAMYLLLVVLPAAIGYTGRRLLARQLSRRTN